MEEIEYIKQANASTYEDVVDGFIEPIYDKKYMINLNYKQLLNHDKFIQKYQKMYSKYTKQYDVSSLQTYIDLDIHLEGLNDYKTNNEKIANQYLKAQQLKLYKIITNKHICKSINEYKLYYNDIKILKKKEVDFISKCKDKIYQKKYHQANKDERNRELKERIANAVHILCSCGTYINPYKKSQHEATIKHKQNHIYPLKTAIIQIKIANRFKHLPEDF